MIESISRAGVVKQADTRDLKSRASQEACRFKSGLQHQIPAPFFQEDYRVTPHGKPDNQKLPLPWRERAGVRGIYNLYKNQDPGFPNGMVDLELEIADWKRETKSACFAEHSRKHSNL